MDSHAIAPRFAAEPVDESLEDAIAAAGRRSRAAGVELTPVLLRYWREMPRHSVEQRRAWLASTCARVRTGETTPPAFVPHALGDGDEEIVHSAVAEYLGTHPVSIERRRARVAAAVDWVKRGLALNRGAVFAALLAAGDEAVNQALSGVRLALTHSEIEVVCRRVSARTCRATRDFLADWRELVDACERPDVEARRILSQALAMPAD